MKIIQLVNGYMKGDGVGNVISAIDSLLRVKGFETEIYDRLLDSTDLDNSDFQGENLVLYHVAVSVDPLVTYLRCKKVLVFHNITDPELLIGPGLQRVRNGCSAGLYDIRNLAKYFDSAIVPSDYSKRTLVENGWIEDKIYQVPYMVRFDKLSQDYDKQIVEEYSDDCINILFTGRIIPNKKQEDIIYSFAKYKGGYNKKARLFLVGSVPNVPYFVALKNLVKELHIENDVIFTGRVPFSQYISYYKLADVFLCMSAHEGFCIPLVEALYYNVPIIAINSTAVPDTLRGSGVLLDDRDPDVVAKEIDRLVSNADYKKKILDTQKARLSELRPKVVEKLYLDVLSQCISQVATEGKYKVMDLRMVVSDYISVPQRIQEGENVIYGYGAAGNRLRDNFIRQKIKVVCVCDQNRGGKREGDIDILYPKDAFIKYRNKNYIISIQSKKTVKEVICMLMNNGISEDNIFIFDGSKDEIV